MMKKMSFIILVLLVGMGTALADVTIDLTGEMEVIGQKWFNYNMATDNQDGDKDYQFDDDGDDPAYDWSNYEQEVNFKAVLNVEDRSFITAEFHVHGDDYDDENGPEVWGMGEDDDFDCDYIWMTHIFPTDTTLSLGLMHSGTWATSFADANTDAYRVMVKQKVNEDLTVIGILEKKTGDEEGYQYYPYSNSYKNAEKDDADTYYLAAIYKAGNMTLKPRIVHNRDGDFITLGDLDNLDFIRFNDDDDIALLTRNGDEADNDRTITKFELGIEGTIGDNIGYEGEVAWHVYDWSSRYFNTRREYEDWQEEDADVWGLYLNCWIDLDSARVGAFIAHGSYDEDSFIGFEFGDDFETAEILGDEFDTDQIIGPAEEYSYHYNEAITDTSDDFDGSPGLGMTAADAAEYANANALAYRKAMSVAATGDLSGQTALQVYADIPVNDKLTICPSLTFVMSNIEYSVYEVESDDVLSDGNLDTYTTNLLYTFEDETEAYELDVEGKLKITDAFTYAAGLAWASIDYGQPGMIDPEDIWKFWHSFTLTF